MFDTLFWYTGVAAWVLMMFGVVSVLLVESHDRSVMKRTRHRKSGEEHSNAAASKETVEERPSNHRQARRRVVERPG
jgi:hypothetical protein